ncbi:hypothetical protein [Streptomyces sp. WZ-12]|uniref:hypothetical protein n=1 Tax=Streptomyces sp. WZ-12 TaxID=3030210 RepID=UPI0031581FA4
MRTSSPPSTPPRSPSSTSRTTPPPPAAALRRAIDREGPAWEDWYLTKLANSPGTNAVHDLDSAAAHLRAETALTRRLLATTPWNFLPLHTTTRTAPQTFTHTRTLLTPLLNLTP